MEPREIQMVKELCELESGMQDGELSFVEDLSHRPDSYTLSEKQLAWLERIWRRCILGSTR
jgi:hypothetical protein